MGSLWIAHHIDLDLRVAIKFLHPELVSDEVLRKRFAQEAKAAARIKNRHVVDVRDHGIDDELPYITMELLSGEDLRARLTRRGRLHPEEALQLLNQMVSALDDAHKLGIVHRDLKPENIFLARDGADEIVKILDFGIAKWSIDIRTASGVVIGTLSYMSPEQVRGLKDLDARSDLWSLAVVLFEMLTGTRIFKASTDIGESIKSIVTDPIPPVTSLAPELPAALDQLFLRALSRDRSQRFQTAPELLKAFAAIVESAALTAHHQGGALPDPPVEPSDARPTSNADALVSTLPLPAAGSQPAEPTRTAAYAATIPLHLVKKSPAVPHLAAERDAPERAAPKPMLPTLLKNPTGAARNSATPIADPPERGRSRAALIAALAAVALVVAIAVARIL